MENQLFYFHQEILKKALKTVNRPLNIYVVDPNPESLNIAK